MLLRRKLLSPAGTEHSPMFLLSPKMSDSRNSSRRSRPGRSVGNSPFRQTRDQMRSPTRTLNAFRGVPLSTAKCEVALTTALPVGTHTTDWKRYLGAYHHRYSGIGQPCLSPPPLTSPEPSTVRPHDPGRQAARRDVSGKHEASPHTYGTGRRRRTPTASGCSAASWSR